MTLRATCGNCNKTVKGGDDWAGRRGKCPSCGAEIVFPRFDVDELLAAPAPSPPTMPTKLCPYCAEEIAESAVKCKHCGAFLTEKPRQPAMPTTLPRPRSVAKNASTLAMGCFAAMGLLVVLIGCVVILSSVTSEPSIPSAAGSHSADDDAKGYRYMAQELIKKRMKAPSTTTFPPRDEWTITRVRDNTYRLSSWVESKNAFGVPLRQRFVAVVNFDGKDYWQLESLDLSD